MWPWRVKMPTQSLLRFVTVANVDDEDCVGNSLLQIWELRFGHKAFTFVQTLSTRFGQYFEVEVQAKLLKLKFGQYFAAEAWWGYEVKVWSKDIEFGIWSRFVWELVSLVGRTQPSGPLCLWQCFILSLMFFRKNRFFCSFSHWISFTRKRSISAFIPNGFPSAKMSISGLVLIGCRERSLEPHQCSSPICTILLLFIHTFYTLLFSSQKPSLDEQL